MSRCTECGCDPEVHARLVRRGTQAESNFKKEASRHAITRAEFELYRLEQEGNESWAQAKVRRQAAEIKRHNEGYRDMLKREASGD